jgi:hypothetical protein
LEEVAAQLPLELLDKDLQQYDSAVHDVLFIIRLWVRVTTKEEKEGKRRKSGGRFHPELQN